MFGFSTQLTTVCLKIADDWNQMADLLDWKRTLYQFSRNQFARLQITFYFSIETNQTDNNLISELASNLVGLSQNKNETDNRQMGEDILVWS